jgi:hypothetical protein
LGDGEPEALGGVGVTTLMKRQSSDMFSSPPMVFHMPTMCPLTFLAYWGQSAPNAVALYTPLHVGGSAGRRHRMSPTGAAA